MQASSAYRDRVSRTRRGLYQGRVNQWLSSVD